MAETENTSKTQILLVDDEPDFCRLTALEQSNRKHIQDLNERVKEFRCLYELGKIAGQPDKPVQDIFQEAAALLPSGWQYPDFTCARIVFGDAEFKTENFTTTQWRQSAAIKMNEESVGLVEVCYLGEEPEGYESPFLNEEQNLLDAIAERLGKIATRKQAEGALRESQERYRSLTDDVLDNLAVGLIVLDSDFKIVWVNRALERYFGLSRDEAIGKDKRQLIRERIKHSFEDPELFAGKVLATYDNNTYVEDFECHVLADGAREERWLEHRSQPICSGLYAGGRIEYYYDITKSKQTEKALRKSIEFVETVFNSVDESISVIDTTSFKIIAANKSVLNTLSMEEGDVIGKRCYEVTHHRSTPCGHPNDICPLTETLKTAGYSSSEHIHYDKSGREINVEVSTYPIRNEKGEIYQLVHVTRDITERKHAERALEEAKQRAEASNEAKSQFLANMSHEIRTPMNAIIGFSDILADAELTNEQKDYVNIIRDAGKHLLQLINDILDFSRIEAAKLEVEMEKCSVETLLAQVESLTRQAALKKGLKYEIRTGADVPPYIRTDHDRLKQCLINLIGNAVKFTDKGHVYIDVSLEDKDGRPHIRFDIEDTGIGIPQDRQEDIFEPFTQVDGSATRDYDGAGLGLSITKQIAALLGGDLNLTSEEGKGSRFSLSIPVGMDVTERQSKTATNRVEQAPENENGIRQLQFHGHVLVAEDVLTNQMLVEKILRQMGLEVTLANDGNEAVQKALARQFDLILMDIQMPEMNGYEATRTLRRQGMQIPIVALTAHAMKGDDEECLAAGCDDYLSKPIDRRQLIGKLAKYLSPKQQVVDDMAGLTESQHGSVEDAASDNSNGVIVNWDDLIARIGDEKILEEIVPVYLKDNNERTEQLTAAADAGDIETIRLCAHALKGAGRNLGAKRLSDVAHNLECAGREGNMAAAAPLIKDLKNEFEKVASFLSRPDWIDVAKREKVITNEKLLADIPC